MELDFLNLMIQNKILDSTEIRLFPLDEMVNVNFN